MIGNRWGSTINHCKLLSRLHIGAQLNKKIKKINKILEALRALGSGAGQSINPCKLLGFLHVALALEKNLKKLEKRQNAKCVKSLVFFCRKSIGRGWRPHGSTATLTKSGTCAEKLWSEAPRQEADQKLKVRKSWIQTSRRHA